MTSRPPAVTPKHWNAIEPALRRSGLYNENSLEMYKKAAKYLDGVEDPSSLTQDRADGIRELILKERAGQGKRNMIVCLKALMKRAYGRTDLILKAPRYKPTVKDVLEVHEVTAIADRMRKHQDPAVVAAFLVQYGSVLRVGEVCKLNVDDFDLDAREIKIQDGKTGSAPVSMTQEAADAVRRLLAGRASFRDELGQAAFVTSAGRRITKKFMTHHLKSAAAACGVQKHRVYPHMIRASGITHLLNMGTNPGIVQRLARHGNFATTMIYNRPTRSDARRVLDDKWGQIARMGSGPNASPQTLKERLEEQFKRGEITLQELIRGAELLGVAGEPERKRFNQDYGVA